MWRARVWNKVLNEVRLFSGVPEFPYNTVEDKPRVIASTSKRARSVQPFRYNTGLRVTDRQTNRQTDRHTTTNSVLAQCRAGKMGNVTLTTPIKGEFVILRLTLGTYYSVSA